MWTTCKHTNNGRGYDGRHTIDRKDRFIAILVSSLSFVGIIVVYVVSIVLQVAFIVHMVANRINPLVGSGALEFFFLGHSIHKPRSKILTFFPRLSIKLLRQRANLLMPVKLVLYFAKRYFNQKDFKGNYPCVRSQRRIATKLPLPPSLSHATNTDTLHSQRYRLYSTHNRL